jgi:hypothetical protein
MSTQSYYTPTEQVPVHQNPRRDRGPSWFRIVSLVIGAVIAVALVALAVVLSHSHSTAAPATNSAPTTSTSVPANPATPTTPVHPVQPSAAVKTLQQQLGQLNYYEGPDDGIMGPQTVQAIKYLQRDAHLPQTGQMNAATQAALANFLAHGNNQMGGNS